MDWLSYVLLFKLSPLQVPAAGDEVQEHDNASEPRNLQVRVKTSNDLVMNCTVFIGHASTAHNLQLCGVSTNFRSRSAHMCYCCEKSFSFIKSDDSLKHKFTVSRELFVVN